MGFWQHLADSYDKNADALKKTYPLSTTSISNNSGIVVIIIIDGNGKFVGFDKIEKAKKDKKTGKDIIPTVHFTIPVTEKSMGRSSNILPHPIFDQYGYLKGRGKKFEDYIAQLKEFAESKFATASIKAIYQYVKDGGIESDIQKHDKDLKEKAEAVKKQKKELSKNEKEKLKNLERNKINPEDKTNIIFQVEVLGNSQTKVWKDETFFDAWHQYYLAEKEKLIETKKLKEGELDKKVLELEQKKLSPKERKRLTSEEKEELKAQAKNIREEIKKEKDWIDKQKNAVSTDYITGEEHLLAIAHPKKISNASGNSKLVSDNDKTNYTFRGKFSDSSEAVSIGYETSQKAHQFLRYLINDRGYYCGEQVILSFTIGSMEKSFPPPIEDKSIWALLQSSSVQTDSDIRINLRAETGNDYADALGRAFGGFGHGQALKKHARTAVFALDAATTGRLSITFYRELDRNEYLERVADWHSSCKWHQQFWDKVDEKYVPYAYIGAPSMDKIIEAVYGMPRGAKDESYTKIKKAARERLLRCVFDGAFLPTDYVIAAVRRASNPLAITKNGRFDRNGFEQIASTACALVRKDFQQRNKEDYKVSIELDRTDRDYLYGRLLGAADKLEEYALYKKDNDRVVTAAIRHMQTFAQRPFRTWQTIHGCLNPYIQTVKGGFAFNEIQDVKNLFKTGDYEKDTPLNGSYLIGYYHERAYIDSLIDAAAEKKKQSTNLNKQEDTNDGQ